MSDNLRGDHPVENEIILETSDLKKYFGPVRALDGVSLSVQRVEVFGFLGPNRAGKTTTISAILSLIHPTGGEVRLFGQPVSPAKNRALQRVGSLVGAPALMPYLSARQNLELEARRDGDRLTL
jgi:ABC-type multidrug transport system ATPase subunit